jgi:1,4-dihydroxy-2-naphthoyl-CoA hydrolase
VEPDGKEVLEMTVHTDPQGLVAAMPYSVLNGVAIEEASPERVTGRMQWTPERTTAGGNLHGAAVLTLADSLGAICAYLNLPPGAGTSTIASSSHFFRGIRGGAAHAVARPLHAGRRTVVVQTEIRDDENRLVAQVIQTQAVLDDAAPMGTFLAQ